MAFLYCSNIQPIFVYRAASRTVILFCGFFFEEIQFFFKLCRNVNKIFLIFFAEAEFMSTGSPLDQTPAFYVWEGFSVQRTVLSEGQKCFKSSWLLSKIDW